MISNIKMVVKMSVKISDVKLTAVWSRWLCSIMLRHAGGLAAREGVIQLEFADNSTRRRSQHRQEYKQR